MKTVNPDLDLQIERLIQASPETVWRCWEDPALFKQWFTPKPVAVIAVDNDLRSGGRAYNVMRLPDGSEMENDGCFVHVERARRLVMTDGMRQGFRPMPSVFMVADITLTPQDGGTLYHAHVMHAQADAKREHEAMGFASGWGTTLDQLDALARTL